MSTPFVRSFPLEDIHVRSGGDGRTVEAYAAVFDTPTEIHDQDGHYNEVIGRSSFTKTLSERGTRYGVFFNHGMTLYGTPSERHSMPIGTPQEVRAEARGVLTVTRYNKTPLADEVLEAINSGAITGQSFSGRMIQSSTDAGVRRPYRARNGVLPTVTRTEIAMTEYGPTPMPAYEDAGILGVRGALLDAYRTGGVDLDELEALVRGDFGELRPALVGLLVRAGRREIDTNDPGTDESQPPAGNGTPTDGAAADEPITADGDHSGPTLMRAAARARLMKMGILL